MKGFRTGRGAVLGAVFLLLTASASADTLYLKNGKSLEGLISQENENGVVINVGGGTVVFRQDEIARIERSTPEGAAAIKKDWELSRAQSEKRREQDLEDKRIAAEKWEAMAKEELRRGAERRYMDENAAVVPAAMNGGHIVVKVLLNEEVSSTFIVDTGCPVVLLTAPMARKLDIDLENAPPGPEVMVLNGKHKVRQVLLKSVKVGGVEEKKVTAQALLENDPEIDKQLKGGLLGMSFLGKFDMTFDQKNLQLILKPRLKKQ